MDEPTYGGTDGEAFTDLQANAPIKRVDVRSGQYIDRIAFSYADEQIKSHGGQGGTQAYANINWEAGEVITAVAVWSGGYIDGIEFFTSEGRRFRFGQPSSTWWLWSCLDQGNKPRRLDHFNGRATNIITALQAVWGNIPPNPKSPTKQNVQWSRAMGKSYGGTYIDMITKDPRAMEVVAVTVGRGDANWICNLEVQYRDGSKTTMGHDGHTTTFRLDGGDTMDAIIRIDGSFRNDKFYSMNFYTRLGKAYHHGQRKGFGFSWSPTESSAKFVGFQGRAGDWINYLTAIWAVPH